MIHLSQLPIIGNKTMVLDRLNSSLPYNDDLSRTNIFAFEIGSSSMRQHIMNGTNIDCIGFNGGAYGCFAMNALVVDEGTFANSISDGFFTNWGMFFFQLMGNLYIKNATFTNNLPNHRNGIVMNLLTNIYIDGLTVASYDGFPQSGVPFLFSSQVNEGLLEIRNLIVENSNMNSQLIFGGNPSLSNVTLSSITFRNTTTNPNTEMLFIYSAKSIKIQDFQIDGARSADSTDTETSLVTISLLDLVNYESYFTNITYSNSSITPIKIARFSNSGTGKTIKYTNSIFKDSEITSPRGIITMNKISTTSNVQFLFDNLTFSNIKFSSNGLLMELNHQLPTNVTVENCAFDNIENGYIQATTPSISDTGISTMVNIQNITVNNVKEATNPFISLTEQAKLYISGSRFTNIFSFFEGAVISGGAAKTETIIQDSVFQNNTAQKGAVKPHEKIEEINNHYIIELYYFATILFFLQFYTLLGRSWFQ